MKRLLSLILCVAVLVSTTVTAQAKESEDEAYHTINVEFSDSDGVGETLQVMVKNDNVYANAEELGKRLGYQVNISEEYVSIGNKEEGENVPYGLTVFYFNSTKISHMLFNKMVDYEAPFEIVKNEEGAWIPLEQSLLLLNSSMLIVDNAIIIDMPEKNIIDIYMDILKNNSTLLFDWNSDFGYTDWDWKVIGSASHVVNMFNGLLKKDGDTWVQFVQMFAMNTSSYDSKYGEAIAELFCTYSDEELSQEVQKMKKVMGYFDTSGTLGKTLKTLEKTVPSDADIKALQETCNQLREKIDGSSTSIAAYNRAYQALENATDEATLFADSMAGSILEIEKNVSSVTGFMDKVFKIAEIVGYAKEFQNQDKFAVETLDEYISNSDSQSLMSKAMKSGISDYINILKTDIASYSALKYLNENYDSLIMKATDLSSALGTQANLELIAWDLIQSANILKIGDKIKAADKFELALYSSVFQSDAFVAYQNIRNSVFSNVSDITSENLYSVSQYCYMYLKSCYITRNAAVASLKGKTEDVQKQIQPLIDYENGINETIAKYLVCLKDADRTNEKLCYGFLPEDNEEYLKKYDRKELSAFVENFVKANSEDIDVCEYLENWEEIPEILNMQITDNYWQFPDSKSYVQDAFYLEWHDNSFGMKNEGYADVAIYGINIGDTVEVAEKILEDNNWISYYQNGSMYSYCTVFNEKSYYFEMQADSNGNIVFWYLNNYPEGDGMWELLEIAKIKNDSSLQEWKKAYIEYICMQTDDAYSTFSAIFTPIYVNNDEIPELLIEYGSISGGGEICTFDGKQIQRVHTYSYGVSYIERKNLFCDSGGRMDEYYEKIYCIENGTLVELESGEFGVEDNSKIKYDGEGMPIFQYYWNGKEMSETEYQQNLLSCYDKSQAVNPYENNGYNIYEIIEKIKEM